MNCFYGGGFIPIIIYATGQAVIIEDHAILTESSLELLTESGNDILVEAA